ncbi:Chromate resistance protein ChrB [Specibacter cremeus]|uniref:Chromate resistance protein ChrB n=1 Tax=Specibacter cremeus TaxID=1629051 RepID=UPI000F77BCF9|nr:Chromate resistance protein ChrB [Specibacter cremeus]
MNWLLLIVRLTGETSRTRVGVWRELRKIGAAPVSSGVWTVPDTPHFSAAVAKVVELAGRGSGDVLVLPTGGAQAPGEDALRSAFTGLRLDEWQEFAGDCAKFEAEIAKEIRNGKFTLAELEEEEQSLDRLRRWYRELKSRDVLELPEAEAADELLRQCATVFDGYADSVYATLHAPAESASPGPRA